jgi:hypothetical protein
MTPFPDRGLVELTKCLRVVGGELFEAARLGDVDSCLRQRGRLVPVSDEDPHEFSSLGEQACSLRTDLASGGDEDHGDIFLEFALILVFTLTIMTLIYFGLARRDPVFQRYRRRAWRGMSPNSPAREVAEAWAISASVFMTNGLPRATGSLIGCPL